MILNILIYSNGDTPQPATELRLESDSFFISPTQAISELDKDNNDKIKQTVCTEGNVDFMAVSNPPMKAPFWMVKHNDKVYCFQTAFLTNKEGKTVQKYG